MKYLALYRKYRPVTFDDVSGQKIVVQTLKNVIKNDKLTHSYLFIGPRGTGKTSIAKIFAKTINCEHSVDGISCEKCENCISSNSNENIDIIEMDAASNNGVDEIREIKNHVTLLPSKSKYKVYIIDEVHMLTIEAFNALLKTLEEPPQHVIFILATTEPQKIPLTIKSRCQNFEFKLLSENDIKNRLEYICEQENINIDNESLDLIAKSSNGGMRDALSFLDQVNAYSDNNITIDDVNLLNGRISKKELENLLILMKNNDFKQLFECIDEYENKGKNFSYICEDLSNYLKNLLIDFQNNKSNDIFDEKYKTKIMDSILELSTCINNMKLTKDKRIYFDLSIIKVCNILGNENLAVNNNEDKKEENNKDLFTNKMINKEKKLDDISENTLNNKVEKEKNYDLYKKLMDIRLNNILLEADKNSIKNYKEIFDNLSSDISDLNLLKITNLLSDCSIKAGSKKGFVLTTSNDNILEELYDNYKLIEDVFSKKSNNDVIVCIIKASEWIREREVYVKKIKMKEKLDFINDFDIIKEIEKESESSDFDDLLEVGE